MMDKKELARLINGGLRNGVTTDDLLKCKLGNNSIGEYIADAIISSFKEPQP